MPMDLRRSMEEAARRAEKRVRGLRKVEAFGLDGERVFAIQVPEGTEIPDQLRMIAPPQIEEAERLGLRGVEDCDRAGRTDLLRCFLYDRPRGRYEEVTGGHDRLPSEPIADEVRYDFRGYEWLAAAHHEVFEAFPPGEIAFVEALLLAWASREFENQVPVEEAAARFDAMAAATGIARRFSPLRVAEHWARVPALRTRWLELRAKAAPTP